MTDLCFPNFDIENLYNGIVAGIDEAGRGPLCGSVVASCVILNKEKYPNGLNDSKKLSEKRSTNTKDTTEKDSGINLV